MKRILKITAFAFVIMLGSSLQNKTSAQYNPNDDVSYQTFYDELSPYGDWIEYPGYGYVWQPQMGDDFRPYSSGGQWVWSDNYEWMWVSDYDWGWAPFHYGRWFQDEYYGWLWQPGYEWSSAWVAWRDGGDYYGWAPLRPGINISINFNIGGYNPPNDYWCFAPRRYITSRNIHSYCVDRRQNFSIINYTTIINNYNYGGGYGFRSGPRRYDAERYCGRIQSVSFRDSYRPGRTQFRNNEVSVYRPNVRHDDNRNFSPRRFDRYDRDNRTARNDNGFRRNNNDAQRNDNNTREQQSNNNNRRFDRNDINGQRNNNDARTPRQFERPVANPGNGGRRFDRNENNGQRNNNNEVRTPRQFERPVTNPDNGGRRFDRNENNGQRNNDNDVRNPRQFERPVVNPNNNNNDSRRFDRRTVDNGNSNAPVLQPQQQSSPETEQRRVQEQPRQFERRSEGNRQQHSNDGNNGNRNGRRRE